MNYKELQKLNEIIENLKSHSNSDENIQFVLDLAQQTITSETLHTLIQDKQNLKNSTTSTCVPFTCIHQQTSILPQFAISDPLSTHTNIRTHA